MLWPATISSSCRWIWRRSSNLRPLGTTPEPNLTLIEIHICSPSWPHVVIIWKTFIGHVIEIIVDFSYQDECCFFQWIVHSQRDNNKLKWPFFTQLFSKERKGVVLAPCSTSGRDLNKIFWSLDLSTKSHLSCQQRDLARLYLDSFWCSGYLCQHCCQLKVPVYVDLFRPLLQVTGANQTRALGTSRRPLLFVQWA